MCDCEQRLAEIAATQDAHGAALNSIGQMLTHMQQVVLGVVSQFQGKSPADLLKGMFSNGR